jgi:asparagine synthase (glutamine-hydrolysing)
VSGIAGIIHFDGRPVEPCQVESMTSAMHYRGPDGIHHWRKANVALGQCMLRTTPESEEETQPLANEDESLVLVMDGRVDNWEELRRDLLGKGPVLRTRADAELVLRAYEVWGRDCLSRIDGDFALVIWDARRQQAFCARDRVGNKPFNYHWDGRTLAFASDLHAILQLPWVPEVLNEGMVAEHLAMDWQSRDETLWQGVMRLVPAHFMVVGAKGLKPSQYWTPDLAAKLVHSSDGEYIEHYRALFTDVVRRMSRSNRPLACEVSGGLDSSAIFAVAETLRQQGGLLAPGLEGYTLDFSGDPDADEMDFCRAVGVHLGRTIHEVLPAFMPLAWYQERARLFRELPGYPNVAMHLNILSEARRGGCKVLLGGTGGDDWLGGSPLYYAEALERRRGGELLQFIRRDAQDVGLRTALWWLLRFGVLHVLPHRIKQSLRAMVRSRQGKEMASLPWLSTALKERLNDRRRKADRARPTVVKRIGQQRQLQLLTDGYITLARELIERQDSAAGIEWRQPFWNRRIIEIAFATPEHLRLHATENKWMHRRAMSQVLPQSVVNRSTKADFTMTLIRDWAQMKLLIRDDILPQRPGWLNTPLVSNWIQEEVDLDRFPWSDGMIWMVWALLGADAVATTVEPADGDR